PDHRAANGLEQERTGHALLESDLVECRSPAGIRLGGGLELPVLRLAGEHRFDVAAEVLEWLLLGDDPQRAVELGRAELAGHREPDVLRHPPATLVSPIGEDL